MLKKSTVTIVIALCTSAALIAFAFDQRNDASITVPAVAFFVAAAIMCLLTVLYALLRCKITQNKTPNEG